MLRKRFMPQCFTADDDLRVMGSSPSRPLGPTIRCLLWNMLKAKRSKWEEDFTELVADRDLVLLQEAVTNAPTDPIFQKSQRFEWVMARSFKDPLNNIEHGVKTGATASANASHFYLSPHAEPVSQTQKLLLTTRYPLVGGKEHLLVLNMHAINFVGVRKYVEQLDQLTCALSTHTGPIVLGGDFNTWNPERLSHFRNVASSAGLLEANMARKSRLSHMNQHLDHLFYRGLTVEIVESLAFYTSSDHAPITATFRYRS